VNVSDTLRADAALYEKKARDYANGDDPFENFRFAANFTARVCREMTDHDPRRATVALCGVKISRMQTLGFSGDAANEGILDTIRDLRVYLAILEALSQV
jgi:hypothetical protein